MVGCNGQPLCFGNALDYYRRVLFFNRPEAERVYAEFLGNPSELSDQDKPGPYKEHVAVQYRKRPHKLGQIHGEPPAHAMLAAYSGNIVGRPPVAQPAFGLCVITTQKNCHGDVVVAVWQDQLYFGFAEGMKFHLLDCIGSNIPAVMSCGVLRVDERGRYPSAPDEIYRLWDQAQALCLRGNECVGGMAQATMLRQSLNIAGPWFGMQRQLQWQYLQDQQPLLDVQQAPIQQHTSMAMPALQRSIEPIQQKALAPDSRKRKQRAGCDTEETEPRKVCRVNSGGSGTQQEPSPTSPSSERCKPFNEGEDNGTREATAQEQRPNS